jgi:hypothetical protein
MNSFSSAMSKKNDEELLKIIIVERFSYTPEAIEAAESEISHRKIDNLEDLKKKFITNNFQNFQEASLEQLIEIALNYKVEHKKKDVEISYILEMGGIDQEAAKSIVHDLVQVQEEIDLKGADRDILIGGITLAIGLIVTFYTFSNSVNTGSYVVAWGAIIYGASRLFKGTKNKKM